MVVINGSMANSFDYSFIAMIKKLSFPIHVGTVLKAWESPGEM
jgi:hypothetical protein